MAGFLPSYEVTHHTHIDPPLQQTGISEVFLEVSEKDMEKERMRKFVEAVEASGLNLSEGAPYKQIDPHRSDSNFNKRFKPWEVMDE